MGRLRTAAVFASVALVAAAGGAAFYFEVRESRSASGKDIAERVYAARFSDLNGEARGVEAWRGRILVVNFWATWCAPCRTEVPMFVRMQERYGGRGLQLVGIAIDQPAKVAAFAHEFGINYPILVGGPDAIDLMRQVGNGSGALPYTLVIDRQGKVAGRRLGELKESQLFEIIAPLLQ